MEVRWDELAKSLGEQGLEILKGVAEGTQEDLKAFGVAIGKDMVLAVKAEDDDWQEQLFMQMKQIASIQRIRLNEGMWEFAKRGLTALIKVARGALLSGGLL